MTGHNGDGARTILMITSVLALTALTILAVVPLAQKPAWPALAVVMAAWAVVLTASLLRQRQPVAPLPAPPDAAPSPPPSHPEPAYVPPQEPPLESVASAEILEFANEVHGQLRADRLHQLIARRLPELLGLREIWVVAQFGSRRVVITPTGANGESVPPMLTGAAAEWATFPMKIDQVAVGVLGVGLPFQRFTQRDRLLLSTVASVLGRALRNSDLFETLRERSMIDPLTGCLLRQEGMRRLDAELRRGQRFGRPVALLLLDLDLFKSVNDQFGHDCGDAVLSSVGAVMLRTLRASDLRCRWGGEEFLVVLPESPVGPARRVAESLRRHIADVRVSCGGRTAATTASIGVVVARPGDLDAQRLVSRADKALYQAKHAGRNCVKVLLGESSPAPDENRRSRAGSAGAPDTREERKPEQHEERGEAPPSERPAVDRRDASRPDRRRVPSPGRRRTDPGVLDGPWTQSR